ncbi:hypothetical protein L6452_35044 [Arctium lappa]|uniref:Uncharacterized protein n=1 Tax=Arctium lappa TaxID=4217 RepID=A0ACB8YKL6_ARCLA|nr:hypothetical protein L6452_35044 [Arctium lappa]
MADNGENARQRVRRPSARIMLKTAFSRFVNTADNPLCLDGVTPTEQTKKDEGQSRNDETKSVKIMQPAKPTQNKKDGEDSRCKRSRQGKHAKGKEVEEELEDDGEQVEPLKLNQKRRSHTDSTLDERGMNEKKTSRSSVIGNKRKAAANSKSEEIRSAKHVRTRSQTSEKMKGKGKACVQPDENSDSDFEEPQITNIGIKINEDEIRNRKKKIRRRNPGVQCWEYKYELHQ